MTGSSINTDGNATGRSGRIIVVRHGRPNLNRNEGPRLNWREYRDWWAAYERASLDEGQEPPRRLIHAVRDATTIFASIRPRAIETAQAFAGDRTIETCDLFVEAPLPPPRWPENRRFLPKTWNIIARLSWMMGHADGDEPISEAQQRAGKAVSKLISTAETSGSDVVLAAHGWFNRMLRPHFKRNGWACVRDGGDSYWSFRIYEKR